MALVTITTFNSVREAELSRMALEVEGIHAVLLEDGRRLQVDESDVDAADAVLNRISGVADAEYVAPSDASPWQPPQTCPSCSAAEVVRRQKWVAFATFAAFVFAIAYTQDATLLGFYLVAAAAVYVLLAPSWRCRHCGNTW
jgi:hypothetical protein